MLNLEDAQYRIQNARRELFRLTSAEPRGHWRMRIPAHDDDSDVVFSELLTTAQRLLDEYKTLQEKYSHEGGSPQVMTDPILKQWLASLSVPLVLDVYQTSTTNVFYVSFSRALHADDKAQIEALGFTVVYANSPLRNRYMMKWTVARNDES